MKSIHCRKNILNYHKHSLHLEFARKFSLSKKWTTSKVAFIANRLQSQNKYKVDRWSLDSVASGAYRGSQSDPILSCTTSDEIWQFVINNGRESVEDIHRAIRKSISIKDIALCWKLFEYAKSKFLVDANVYSDMVWILNHSELYRNEDKVLRIYRQLMDEMNTVNIKPNFQLVTTLFAFLTKYQRWDDAHEMWNKLKQSQDELLLNIPVWNAYISLNIKQCLIQPIDNQLHLTHVLQLLDEMYNKYNVKPNNSTYGTVIAAVSKLLKRTLKHQDIDVYVSKNDVNYIKIGENLFEQCQEITGQEPYSNVYATMIDLYGNIGDIDKCMKLLNVVIDKKCANDVQIPNYQHLKGKQLMEYRKNGFLDKDEWNERTLRSCIGSTLKSIVNNKEISHVDGWKLIDHIVGELLVNKCGLDMDIVLYGMLFHCHGSFGKEYINMKKVKALYKEMVKKGIKANNLALNNFIVVGSLKYEGDKKKMDKFAKFMLKQFHRHKISMPRVVAVRLNKMMVYHDDDIKDLMRRTDII